ncbi:DUF397 domain-containing protein [Streptomyces paromomycinus]|uniref:DUF397 domain-containing protein n=1 Tax=Streptomyces paromomycinus TaxID=92743 RepID=A0A401W725_STREY|nr:DUF397 domain-containing protein [Streptomyces paromomycinus]GCD45130.1 hypothetical protein GKJPGBOP_04851 [Streptomyces paromomycinus]
MSNGPAWFKSSYSSNEGGECVEISTTRDAVHVRDSADPQGPQLAFTAAAWSDFLLGVRG